LIWMIVLYNLEIPSGTDGWMDGWDCSIGERESQEACLLRPDCLQDTIANGLCLFLLQRIPSFYRIMHLSDCDSA
jgi:hypothetical protein